MRGGLDTARGAVDRRDGGAGIVHGLARGRDDGQNVRLHHGAEVLEVDTLDCLARQTPNDAARVSAVIDAHRSQLFVRNYARGPDGLLTPLDETRIVEVTDWLAALTPGTLVIGPVLEKLTAQLPAGVIVAETASWTPRAATVAQLTAEQYAAGGRDDFWRLTPRYLRRAAAEEKLEPNLEGADVTNALLKP